MKLTLEPESEEEAKIAPTKTYDKVRIFGLVMQRQSGAVLIPCFHTHGDPLCVQVLIEEHRKLLERKDLVRAFKRAFQETGNGGPDD